MYYSDENCDSLSNTDRIAVSVIKFLDLWYCLQMSR